MCRRLGAVFMILCAAFVLFCVSFFAQSLLAGAESRDGATENAMHEKGRSDTNFQSPVLLHGPGLSDLAISSDSTKIVTVAGDIRIWDSLSGSLELRWSALRPTLYAEWLNGNSTIVSTDDPQNVDCQGSFYGVPLIVPRIRLWDISTQTEFASHVVPIPSNATNLSIVRPVVNAARQKICYFHECYDNRTSHKNGMVPFKSTFVSRLTILNGSDLGVMSSIELNDSFDELVSLNHTCKLLLSSDSSLVLVDLDRISDTYEGQSVSLPAGHYIYQCSNTFRTAETDGKTYLVRVEFRHNETHKPLYRLLDVQTGEYIHETHHWQANLSVRDRWLTGFYDDDVSPWIDSRNGSAGKRINWKSAVDGDSDLILRRRWAAASPPILKSTDRVTVVASSASTSIQVLSTATGDRIVSAHGTISCISELQHGMIAYALDQIEVWLASVEPNRPSRTRLHTFGKPVTAIGMCPNSRYLIIGFEDGTLQRLRSDGAIETIGKPHGSAIAHVGIDAAGLRGAWIDRSGNASEWMIGKSKANAFHVVSPSFIDKNIQTNEVKVHQRILVENLGKISRNGRIVLRFMVDSMFHEDYQPQFSPGALLRSGSPDSCATLSRHNQVEWLNSFGAFLVEGVREGENLRSSPPVGTVGGSVCDSGISEDGARHAIAFASGAVAIVDTVNATYLQRIETRPSEVKYVRFVDGGKMFVTVDRDGICTLWDIESSRSVSQLDSRFLNVAAIAAERVGDVVSIVMASSDGLMSCFALPVP